MGYFTVPRYTRRLDLKPLLIENQTAELCTAANLSVAKMRGILPLRMDTTEVLNQFGSLRDTLVRLIEIASNGPLEVLEAWREGYPRLVPDTISALETASRRNLTTVASVRDSCASINDSLLELEYLKQRITIQLADRMAER